MTTAIQTPYEVFIDQNGHPLSQGKIYLGTAGSNPITNPITVYQDSALTIPLAQPLRTTTGLIVAGSNITTVYIAESTYSMVVADKNDNVLYTNLNLTDSSSALRADLASTSNVLLGDNLVVHPDNLYPTQIIQTLRYRVNSQIVNVLDFIPVALHANIRNYTGTTDLSTYLQAAIDSGAGTIFWPAGTYYFVTGLICNILHQNHIGAGMFSTILNFAPSGAGTAFSFLPLGVTNVGLGDVPSYSVDLVGCGFENFTITGSNSQVKTGLKLVGVSQFHLKNLFVTNLGGTASIGLHIKGHEVISAHNISLNFFGKTGTPLVLDLCKTFGASGLDLDIADFIDCYFIGASGYSTVLANGYAYLTNVRFGGYQSWPVSDNGFNQTVSGFTNPGRGGTYSNLIFENVRTEQGTSAAAYTFRLETSNNVELKNCMLDVARNGVYMRGNNTSSRLHLQSCQYDGGAGRTAMDINNSVRSLSWDNCFFQENSTFTITGLNQLFGKRSRDETPFSSAQYSVPISDGTDKPGQNAPKIMGADWFIKSYTIAAAGTQTIVINANRTLLTEIVAYDATAHTMESGIVHDYSTTDAAIAPVAAYASANFNAGAAAVGAKLCYSRAAGVTNAVVITNNLANQIKVTVKMIQFLNN